MSITYPDIISDIPLSPPHTVTFICTYHNAVSDAAHCVLPITVLSVAQVTITRSSAEGNVRAVHKSELHLMFRKYFFLPTLNLTLSRSIVLYSG